MTEEIWPSIARVQARYDEIMRQRRQMRRKKGERNRSIAPTTPNQDAKPTNKKHKQRQKRHLHRRKQQP